MTVVRTEKLTRDLVRVHFTGADLKRMEPLEKTDSYIKLLFPAPDSDITWPFDLEDIRAQRPREEWPVTRTYTVRSLDAEAGTMAVDFVVHGDEGIAGPWAANAQPGQRIGFLGPGGGWAPAPDADMTILVGDESALPAIAAALDALADDAAAHVFIEVSDEESEIALRSLPRVEVTWVHRGDVGYGVKLAESVRGAYGTALPDGVVDVFVHGNAAMIKDLRKFFLVERSLPRERASISGYWRTNHTEDAWQASKREFVAAMEAEQQIPGS